MGFLGQNNVGVDGVLTRGETRRGMAPKWLTAAASLLQAWAIVSVGFGALPPSRSSSMPSTWPPLASRPVQWLQSMTFSSNLVAARVRWVSCFVDWNQSYGMRYLYVFLDRIVDGKNPNTFLVWIELYLAKIWKKSWKGRNRFRLRYEFLVSSQVSDG
jgi:hypothetical protein